jgi:hypothetical protein
LANNRCIASWQFGSGVLATLGALALIVYVASGGISE